MVTYWSRSYVAAKGPPAAAAADAGQALPKSYFAILNVYYFDR
jgi:hypothetical protein